MVSQHTNQPPSSFAPFQATIDPLGLVHVEALVRRGPLFDVYRATLGNERVAVKTVTDAAQAAVGLASSRWSGVGTGFWGGEAGLIEGAVSRDLLHELLVVEAERIRQTKGEWNHDVVGLGVWDPQVATYRDDESAPRRRLVLVTTWFDGTSLDQLSLPEQRRLLPLMLPAFWDALCVQPHGDLQPANVIISPDRSRFALVDPGVGLTSDRGKRDEGDGRGGHLGWQDREYLFTTNALHYPLLPPFLRDNLDAGLRNRVEATEPVRLRALLQAYAEQASWVGPSRGPARSPPTSQPDPADLLALGLWYFRTLTERELCDVVGIADRPAWAGSSFERTERSAHKRVRSALQAFERHGRLSACAVSAGVGRGEDALVQALLDLAIDNHAQLRALLLALG